MKPTTLFSVLILTLCSVACIHQPKRNKATSAVDEAFLMPTAENDSLVNDLALFIVDAIENADAAKFLERFAFDEFMQKVTYTDTNDDLLNNYRKSFIQGYKANAVSIPLEIIKITESEGFYDYLYNIYDDSTNRYTILFRLFDESNGINYHEYEVIHKNGRFYFDDIFVYTMGERISDSSRKMYTLNLPENLLDKFLGQSKVSEDLLVFYDAIKAQQQQEFQKSHDLFESIQGEIRNQKLYHILKLQAAAQLNDVLYMQSLEELVEKFEDDPTTKLMLIDYYYIKQQYEDCMEAIEDLQAITQDSFLNYIKGNIAFGFEKIAIAKAYYTQVVEEYPTYLPAQFNLIAVLSLQGEYTQCITLLDGILEQDKLIYKDELVDLMMAEEDRPLFENLLNSGTFKQWATQ